MFGRKKIKKLEMQLEKVKRQYARVEHEREILLIFRKEIEMIQKENHYGSVDNFSKKIRSAIADSHRLLHF